MPVCPNAKKNPNLCVVCWLFRALMQGDYTVDGEKPNTVTVFRGTNSQSGLGWCYNPWATDPSHIGLPAEVLRTPRKCSACWAEQRGERAHQLPTPPQAPQSLFKCKTVLLLGRLREELDVMIENSALAKVVKNHENMIRRVFEGDKEAIKFLMRFEVQIVFHTVLET